MASADDCDGDKKVFEGTSGFQGECQCLLAAVCTGKVRADVCDILEEEHFPASNLILELTEHCQALDEQILKWHIAEFHKYGVGISADDFGADIPLSI